MKQMKSPNHSKLANEEIRMDVEAYKIGKDWNIEGSPNRLGCEDEVALLWT